VWGKRLGLKGPSRGEGEGKGKAADRRNNLGEGVSRWNGREKELALRLVYIMRRERPAITGGDLCSPQGKGKTEMYGRRGEKKREGNGNIRNTRIEQKRREQRGTSDGKEFRASSPSFGGEGGVSRFLQEQKGGGVFCGKTDVESDARLR